MRFLTSGDTHLKEGINRAKFHVRTPGSLGEVKTHTDTERERERIALYSKDSLHYYLMHFQFVPGFF